MRFRSRNRRTYGTWPTRATGPGRTEVRPDVQKPRRCRVWVGGRVLTLPPKHTSPLRVTLHIYNHVIQMSTARCTQTYHIAHARAVPRPESDARAAENDRRPRFEAVRATCMGPAKHGKLGRRVGASVRVAAWREYHAERHVEQKSDMTMRTCRRRRRAAAGAARGGGGRGGPGVESPPPGLLHDPQGAEQRSSAGGSGHRTGVRGQERGPSGGRP